MNTLTKISKQGAAVADPASFIDRRSGRPRRVSSRLKKVIRLMFDGTYKTFAAASKNEGFSADYLSRAFRKPHVRAYVDSFVRASLEEGKLQAAGRLLDLVHADSEHVSFNAATHTLALSNISPPERPAQPISVNVGVGVSVQAGYVIDLSGGPDESAGKVSVSGLPEPSSPDEGR